MVTYPAARDLLRALVGWVTLLIVTQLIVTREGGRRWKLRPSRRALVTLTHLRGHTALAKIATGSGISEAAAHVHVRGVPGHLAAKAFPFCLPCVARSRSTCWWTAPSPGATGPATAGPARARNPTGRR